MEKILEPGEELPDWPVEGTTGYEFMADATGALRRPGRRGAADRALRGDHRRAARLRGGRRRGQARARRARPSGRRSSGCGRWWTSPEMADAVAGLPVYRTYVEPGAEEVDEHDLEAVEEAELPERVREALVAPRDPDEEAFAIALPADHRRGDGQGRRGHGPLPLPAAGRAQRGRRRPRALGRVARPRCTRATRRAARASRAACWPPRPTTPSARATCARGIGALAAVPERLARAGAALARAERPPARDAPPPPGRGVPDLPDRWSAPGRSSASGSWTTWSRRCARRKVDTDWVDPDEAHERGGAPLHRRPLRSEAFVAELEAFVAAGRRRVGEAAALGQTLLKLTAPGVPDLYQGDELWCLSLVDPDNRRPVDWAALRPALPRRSSRSPARRWRSTSSRSPTRRSKRGRPWWRSCAATTCSSPSRSGRARRCPAPPGDGWRPAFTAPGVVLLVRS